MATPKPNNLEEVVKAAIKEWDNGGCATEVFCVFYDELGITRGGWDANRACGACPLGNLPKSKECFEWPYEYDSEDCEAEVRFDLEALLAIVQREGIQA